MTDKEEHQVITDKLNEILRILNGNGETGMCAKVNILWAGSVVIVGVVLTTVIKTFLF